jgi:hypothetical protein
MSLPNEMSDKDMDEWLASIPKAQIGEAVVNVPAVRRVYPDELPPPTRTQARCIACNQPLGAQNPGVSCDVCKNT